MSRQLLAVPFVGKDVPSSQSEFSHADVVILLSAAAYRLEGLRPSDFSQLLRHSASQVAREVGKVSFLPPSSTPLPPPPLPSSLSRSIRRQTWVQHAGEHHTHSLTL